MRARARNRGQGPNTGNPTEYLGGGGNHGGCARRAHAQKKKEREGGGRGGRGEQQRFLGCGKWATWKWKCFSAIAALPASLPASGFCVLASGLYQCASRFSRSSPARLKILAGGALAVGF